MGNINRSMDASEQNDAHFVNIKGTVTATSDQIYHAPQEMEIQSAMIANEGLSGTPTTQLQIQRFVTGAGETVIPLGPALAVIAVGTSGPKAFAFSSILLQAGDQVVATQAGTNAAVAQQSISLVVKGLQDIRSWDY